MSLQLTLSMSTQMKQEMKLSPQLQLAIKHLQLSRADLIEEIQQELMSNPLLEELKVSPDMGEGSERDMEGDQGGDQAGGQGEGRDELISGERTDERSDEAQERLLNRSDAEGGGADAQGPGESRESGEPG